MYLQLNQIKKHLNIDEDFKNDDEYLNVKIAVAQNSKATADILDELAKNKEFYYEKILP